MGKASVTRGAPVKGEQVNEDLVITASPSQLAIDKFAGSST